MSRLAIAGAIWVTFIIVAATSGTFDDQGIAESLLGAVVVFGIVYWLVHAAAHEANRQPGEKPAFGTRHSPHRAHALRLVPQGSANRSVGLPPLWPRPALIADGTARSPSRAAFTSPGGCE